MKMKRFLSLFLCAALLLCVLPTAAFAVQPESAGGIYVSNLTELKAALGGGRNVELSADIAVDGTIVINHSVSINGKYTLTRADGFTGAIFTVSSGSYFTLYNVTLDGENRAGVTSPLVTVDGGHLFLRENATVKRNADYGGISASNGAYVTVLENAVISGNKNSKIIKEGSTLKMGAGGGISAIDSTLTIGDCALITGNESTGDERYNCAGGIYANNCTTIIEGQAEISGSTSVFEAGGVGANGGTLTLQGSAAVLNNTVTESSHTTVEAGGGVNLDNHATCVIKDNVRIAGNTAPVDGGGVDVEYSTLTVEGNVIITDNQANKGGGVCADNAEQVTIRGNASITSNWETDPDNDKGGGMYICNSNTTICGNATICGNSGGGIYVENYHQTPVLRFEGNASVTGNAEYGVYVPGVNGFAAFQDSVVIDVFKSLASAMLSGPMKQGASIGVFLTSSASPLPMVVYQGRWTVSGRDEPCRLTTNDMIYFRDLNSYKELEFGTRDFDRLDSEIDEVYVLLPDADEKMKHISGDRRYWYESLYNAFDDYVNKNGGGDEAHLDSETNVTLYLNKPLTESGTFTVPNGMTVTVSGAQLSQGSEDKTMFNVLSGGTLILKGVTVQGNGTSRSNSLITVQSGGKLILDSGSIIKGWRSSVNGAAVNNSGALEIKPGALIENCITTAGNGGAVYAIGLTRISGGTIRNCSAQNGGAVYASLGAANALEISGGSIADSLAGADGGGLYVTGNSWKMTGGSIFENTSTGNGGGIYLSGASLTMEGCIYDNISKSGGGIYQTGTAESTIKGTLKGNKATSVNGHGGGICIGSGKMSLDGAKITGNAVDGGHGGGLYLSSDSNASLYLGNEVYLTGNSNSNLYLTDNKRFTTSTLLSNAAIGVSASVGTPVTIGELLENHDYASFADIDPASVTPDSSGQYVAAVGNTLVLKNTLSQLSAPLNPAWSGTTSGRAEWSAVTGASEYRVQFFRDGHSQGQPISVSDSETFCDSTSVLTQTGTYTFTVTAVGAGYRNSNQSALSGGYDVVVTATPALSDQTEPSDTPMKRIALTCATEGAEIRYTLNGSEPTSTSTLYVSPVLISISHTLRVKAFKAGCLPSPEVSASYTITTPKPAISLAPGEYSEPQTISLSCNGHGDGILSIYKIFYTCDGETPVDGRYNYNNTPFTINQNCTVKVKAYTTNWGESELAVAEYTFKPETPVVSPDAGEYASAQSVTLSCATPDVTIRYTTDGTEPTNGSTQYAGTPIPVSSSMTIKAKAFKEGWSDSEAAEANCEILYDNEWTPAPSMKNFKLKGTYKGYSDVDESMWYGTENEGAVRDATLLGLVEGYGDGDFGPEDELKVGEAIKLASVIRSIYKGDKYKFTQGKQWYDTYVDYAVRKGIIKDKRDFTDYTAVCTRAEAAYILAHALPEKELAAIKTLTPPDVAKADKYGAEIYLLYAAGVLNGNDERGVFEGNDTFTRAQAAAIVARICLPDKR